MIWLIRSHSTLIVSFLNVQSQLSKGALRILQNTMECLMLPSFQRKTLCLSKCSRELWTLVKERILSFLRAKLWSTLTTSLRKVLTSRKQQWLIIRLWFIWNQSNWVLRSHIMNLSITSNYHSQEHTPVNSNSSSLKSWLTTNSMNWLKLMDLTPQEQMILAPKNA